MKSESNMIISAIVTAKLNGQTPGYTYKGYVITKDYLPESGQALGDLYRVYDENGADYVWDGNAWTQLHPDIASHELINGLYNV